MIGVILAAGRSSRLRPLTDDTPKCLLSVAGEPILWRALTTLQGAGIDRFILVTGYIEEKIRAAVKSWCPELDVRFVFNDVWDSTNNSYSLLLAVEACGGDPFLLVDGDVVFEAAVAEAMLGARAPNRFALRRADDLGEEEMKVELEGDRLRRLSKDIPPQRAAGEAVGMWVFTAGAPSILAALTERVRSRGLSDEWYEASFQEAVDRGLDARAVDVGHAYVSEIDTPDDLQRVDRAMRELLGS